MAGLWAHFKNHGAIHALWMIGVLLLIIAALLIRSPGGNIIAEYFAFATSIASLVLAIVAIFHSVVSNQSFSETIGSLRTSAESVQTAARNIADTSAILSEQSERMIGEVSRLPPAFQELSEKINEKFTQDTGEAENRQGGVLNIGLAYFDETVYGGKLSFYILALSHLRSKNFSIYDMFADQVVWSNFISGYMHAIRITKPCDIDLGYNTSDESDSMLFILTSIGSLPVKEIVNSFSKMDDEYTKPERQIVDSYFFGLPSAGDDQGKT